MKLRKNNSGITYLVIGALIVVLSLDTMSCITRYHLSDGTVTSLVDDLKACADREAATQEELRQAIEHIERLKQCQ